MFFTGEVIVEPPIAIGGVWYLIPMLGLIVLSHHFLIGVDKRTISTLIPTDTVGLTGCK
jgi:hypothetical protein